MTLRPDPLFDAWTLPALAKFSGGAIQVRLRTGRYDTPQAMTQETLASAALLL